MLCVMMQVILKAFVYFIETPPHVCGLSVLCDRFVHDVGGNMRCHDLSGTKYRNDADRCISSDDFYLGAIPVLFGRVAGGGGHGGGWRGRLAPGRTPRAHSAAAVLRCPVLRRALLR